MKKLKQLIKFIGEMIIDIEHIQSCRYEWKEQGL